MKRKLILTDIVLIAVGLLLQLAYFGYMISAFVSAAGNPETNISFSLMLFSLVIVIACQLIYFVEALFSIVLWQNMLSAFKFFAVLVSAVLLWFLAYRGTVQTVICNVFFLAILIWQVLCLIQNIRLLKTHSKTNDASAGGQKQ